MAFSMRRSILKRPIKEPMFLEASIHKLTFTPSERRCEACPLMSINFAMQLYQAITSISKIEAKAYLHTAALLHRIGASVHYYQYLKHTQYMMTGAHIDGLSHREIVIASFIATYKTKSRTHQQALAYKDLLMESDEALIVKLGTLLKLARLWIIARHSLFKSCNQQQTESTLTLKLLCIHNPIMELKGTRGYQQRIR